MRVSQKISLLIAMAGGVVIFGFNNCSKVQFDETNEVVQQRLEQGAAIIINNDDRYTNQKTVQLLLINNSANEMYVTNDPSCQSGGEWETYNKTKAWDLSHENTSVKVFVKYRENSRADLETECYSDDIVHDNVKPVIKPLLEVPKISNLTSLNLKFDVIEENSGIASLECIDENTNNLSDCKQDFILAQVKEGPGLVKIRAKDNAGNYSDEWVQSWVIDRTAPKAQINAAPAPIVNTLKSQFVFSGTDNVSTELSFQCKVDEGIYANCISPQEFSVTEGEHQFFLKALDEAGNFSGVVSYNWKVDTSIPTVSLTAYPKAYSKEVSPIFEFNGMDNGKPISKFECKIDQGEFANCESSFTAKSLKEDYHFFAVRGYDEAGNRSAETPYNWVVDLTKPTLEVVSRPAWKTMSKNAEVVFIAKDNFALDKVECSLDGAAAITCNSPVVYSGLSQGDHKLALRAYDKAGNMSDLNSVTWTIDNTPPTIEILSGPAPVTNTTVAAFEMRAIDSAGSSSIECRIDNQEFATCSSKQSYLSISEGMHVFYARAVDQVGNKSEPVSFQWLVDLTGPMIKIIDYPVASVPYGMASIISYEVSDNFDKVPTLRCGYPSKEVDCKVTDKLNLGVLAVGNYDYNFIAKDAAGNMSVNLVHWSVVQAMQEMKKSVTVTGTNKADILVVIDNSGSMNVEQANMALRFSSFIDSIVKLDWQLGIITTDVSSNAEKKDGRFLLFADMPTGTRILDSKMNLDNVKSSFGKTIQRPAGEGSGQEQGIAATYRAVVRYSDASTVQESAPNKAFFRSDSSLNVIIVSDADESDSKDFNRPENLLAKIQSTFPGKTVYVHSIIVKSGDSSCLSINGNESYGVTYERLSSSTGGIIGSVCASDYSGQLSIIGQKVIESVMSVTLDCMPLDKNADGKADVTVTLQSGSNVSNFTVVGQNVNFTEPLPAGTHQFKYYCY